MSVLPQMTLESLVVDLSHDPFNPELNFQVAQAYDKEKQTASAVSFYLRTAEYGKDSHPSLVYVSLLKLAKCFEEQNDRLHTVSNCILQAVSYLPYRPEAYFWMARFHERQQNWQECYTWARMGSNQAINTPLPDDVDYHGTYCLMFERAVSAWWIGRKDESVSTFQRLLEMDIAPEYRQAVEDNLARII